jgi:subtilisin family serine protease
MPKRFRMIPPHTVLSRVSILAEAEDYNIKMMNVPAMWRETLGEGCRVVVLDTGLPKHLDLEPLGGKSFIDGYLLDMNGHSTHCAGVIAATARNGMGVCGIAPDVEDYYGAVLDGEGSGAVDDIIRGIRWAVDDLGAHIISMSLGMPAGMPHSRELEAACNYAVSRGCAVIAAAGNEGGRVGQPAMFDSVIAVAAVDNRLQHAEFSNMGEALDFAAGGVNVYSTYLNNSYAKLSGTSMACPALVGIAALIISKHLKEGVVLSPAELREHIQRIAYDVGKDGFDELYGHGIPIFGNTAPLEPDAPGTPSKPVDNKKPAFRKWLLELLKRLGLKKS